MSPDRTRPRGQPRFAARKTMATRIFGPSPLAELDLPAPQSRRLQGRLKFYGTGIRRPASTFGAFETGNLRREHHDTPYTPKDPTTSTRRRPHSASARSSGQPNSSVVGRAPRRSHNHEVLSAHRDERRPQGWAPSLRKRRDYRWASSSIRRANRRSTSATTRRRAGGLARRARATAAHHRHQCEPKPAWSSSRPPGSRTSMIRPEELFQINV